MLSNPYVQILILFLAVMLFILVCKKSMLKGGRLLDNPRQIEYEALNETSKLYETGKCENCEDCFQLIQPVAENLTLLKTQKPISNIPIGTFIIAKICEFRANDCSGVITEAIISLLFNPLRLAHISHFYMYTYGLWMSCEPLFLHSQLSDYLKVDEEMQAYIQENTQSKVSRPLLLLEPINGITAKEFVKQFSEKPQTDAIMTPRMCFDLAYGMITGAGLFNLVESDNHLFNPL